MEITPDPPALIVSSPVPPLSSVESDLFVRILARIPAIQEKLETKTPKKFVEDRTPSEIDNLVVDDWYKYDWTRNTPVSVFPDGDRIGFKFGIDGTLTIGGNVKVAFIKKAVQETASVRATISGSVKPVANSNWTMALDVRAGIDFQEATMKLLNIVNVKVRSLFNEKVSPKVHAKAVQMADEAARDAGTKELARKAWEKLHFAVLLLPNPPTWVKFTPSQLSFINPRVLDNSIETGVGVRGTLQVEVAERSDPEPPSPLPDALIENEATSKLDLKVPVVIDPAALNRILLEKTQSILTTANLPFEFSIQAVELTALTDTLLLRVQFTAEKGPLLKADGYFYLSGTPNYDAGSETISVPDLDFTIETKSKLLEAAVWLIEEKLIELLRKGAKMDVSSHLNEARSSVRERVSTLPFPDGVHGKVEIHSLDVEYVKVANGFIYSLVHCRGRVDNLTVE